jgi:hypothetical protein
VEVTERSPQGEGVARIQEFVGALMHRSLTFCVKMLNVVSSFSCWLPLLLSVGQKR